MRIHQTAVMSESELNPGGARRSPSHLLWFQEDNGLPVHIKGGTGDMMLYRATMAITGIGERNQQRVEVVGSTTTTTITNHNNSHNPSSHNNQDLSKN